MNREVEPEDELDAPRPEFPAMPPAFGPPLWVAAARISFSVPGSRSLKDRRQAVKSLRDRLRVRFNVACADLGPPDSWTRGALGVTVCANEREGLEELLDAVTRYARNDSNVLVGAVERDVQPFD